jgi:F-type H+-transporting ATPase subunit b
MPIITNLFFASTSSSSGIGALGFSLSSFLIQIISFIIIFLILRKFAFKPILKILKERTDLINEGITLGETMKKQKAELEKAVEDELHKTRAQADKIISDAHNKSKEMILSAENDALKKAEMVAKDAKLSIEREAAMTKERLKGELVGLVSEATEAIIGKKIDSKSDNELIDKALKLGDNS